MKLFALLLRTSPRSLLAALLLGLLSGLASVLLLVAIHRALTLSQSGASASQLGWYALLVVAVPLLGGVSRFWLIRLGQEALFRLRQGLVERILATPLAPLEQVRSPRLLAALTEDVSVLGNGVVVLPTLAVNLAMIVASLAYLGWLSPRLFLGLAAGLVLSVASYRMILAAGRRRLERARDQHDVLMARLRDLIQGLQELLIHQGRRREFLVATAATAEGLRSFSSQAHGLFSLLAGWGQLVFFALLGFLMFGLGRWLGASTGEITGYVLLLIFLRGPFQILLNQLPELSRATVALSRIEALGLGLEPQPLPAAGEVPPAKWRRLELRGVSLSYREDGNAESFRLGPVDLELEPGEVVFLTGGNDSGKTTLAKLLLGLYRPESGEILLDGSPVDDASRESYRALFSAVFAEFHLFDRLFGIPPEGRAEQATNWLAELGLGSKLSLDGDRFSTLALSRARAPWVSRNGE